MAAFNWGQGRFTPCWPGSEKEGLIVLAKIEDTRKIYRLTQQGRDTLEQEYQRLRRQVAGRGGHLREGGYPMKQTKRVLFTFSPYEYKGVEVYLNSLAARGWEPGEGGIGPGKLPPDTAHGFDILHPTCSPTAGGRGAGRRSGSTWPCAGRGAGSWWTGGGAWACSPPCREQILPPSKTDRDTEWYHYKRAYRNSLFWAVAAILPMLCLVLIILLAGGLATAGEALIRAFRFTWQRSWVIAIWQAALPVLFAAGLWKIGGFSGAGARPGAPAPSTPLPVGPYGPTLWSTSSSWRR